MKHGTRFLSILISLTLVVTSLFVLPGGTVAAYAAGKGGYVSALKLSAGSATITIPSYQSRAKKSYKITVKTTGKQVSKAVTVKSSNKKVAAVKYNAKKKKLIVTAKKPGTAVIRVTTKAKNKKGKSITKKLKLKVVKGGSVPTHVQPASAVFYTVSFNSNGGSAVDAQSVQSGGLAALPATPVKDGSGFVGWYTDAELNNPFSFNTPVNGDITLYARWDDSFVRFESFYSNVTSMPAGDNKSAVFYATLSYKWALTKEPEVYNSAGQKIAVLNDRGINGDLKAGDGVYSSSCSLGAQAQGSRAYYAKYGSVSSNAAKIFFYTEITDEQYETAEKIIQDVSELDFNFDVRNYLSKNKNIIGYSDHGDMLIFRIKPGITCVWYNHGLDFSYILKSKPRVFTKGTPKFDSETTEVIVSSSGLTYNYVQQQLPSLKAGYRASGAKTDVCSVMPFHGTQLYNDDFRYAGEYIADVLGGTYTEYEDADADVDCFRQFDRYGVVMFDTHGDHYGFNNLSWTDAENNPYLLTDECFYSDDYGYLRDYSSAELESEGIVFNLFSTGDNYSFIRITLGSAFFDINYSGNSLDGAMFYLGSCSGMYNNSLAQSLINKGAELVFGFSNTVSCVYCNDILFEVMLNQLLLNHKNAEDAYNGARAVCGSKDFYYYSFLEYAELKMAGDKSYTLISAR